MSGTCDEILSNLSSLQNGINDLKSGFEQLPEQFQKVLDGQSTITDNQQSIVDNQSKIANNQEAIAKALVQIGNNQVGFDEVFEKISGGVGKVGEICMANNNYLKDIQKSKGIIPNDVLIQISNIEAVCKALNDCILKG